MTDRPFVPEGFAVPAGLETPAFRLEPLGPQHNASDHAAWSSSIAHIRSTPGLEGGDWPPVDGMSLDANREDLEGHARDFAERTGFTYTVLAPGGDEVIGCLYLYPARDGEHDARAVSWVRADLAHLDAEVYDAVSRWLAEAWPWERVVYAPR
jgi:hypothetical protein